jgi:hypothetical protein
MISKAKIGIALASTMVASAMVYAAVAHNHHEPAALNTVNPHVEQIPSVPKPAAGKPLDAGADANQADASGDLNAQSLQPADSGDDQNQNQANADDLGNAVNSDRTPAPAVTAQQQPALYAATAIRVHPVAKLKVAKLIRPMVAAASINVDRPMASVRSVPTPVVFVPTGTPLTMRLNEPLGSKISQVDQSFAGTVDRDVDVQGRTVIPAGARVTGKVVAVRSAGRLAGEANLQLEVTSVNVSHREFEVRTSIRIFGPAIQGKNKLGRFMKGLGKRLEGEEHEVQLEQQTAYTFNLSSPLQIQ